MKQIFNFLLPFFAAMAVAACSENNNNPKEHEQHTHEHHAHEQHTHEHHAHEQHTHEQHAHEEHAHEEHAHEHNHLADAHSHAHSTEEASANVMTFTHAQQSKIDFAISRVEQSDFNGAVKVAAQVAAAPGNFTTVVATSAGRLRYVGNMVEGKAVGKGEPLFALDGGNVTDNDVAVKYAAAESNFHVAKADYERKQSLYENNIISLKELQEAEALFLQAQALYNSMKSSYNGGKMVLKAPLNGYVSSLLADNGAYVQPGTPIAQIQCQGDVNITAELPVRYATALKNISAVNIELPDGKVYSLDELKGHVAAVGHSVNACNMIPVTVAVKNLDEAVPGSIVTLHLSMSLAGGAQLPVVPRSSLIEEMGNYFVFVHKGGESFEKRQVQIGATDGSKTQIKKGVVCGEHVVSQGAMSLKLSQGAAALDPHAGHVH